MSGKTTTTAQAPNFTGPFFIVGLSRSGTKLLREILNKHPAIRISNRESYFVPHVLGDRAVHWVATPQAAEQVEVAEVFGST